MRDLVFLPDREGRDELTAATGFVRCGSDASALRGLAARLVVKEEDARHDAAAWRGTLAVALLADTWPEASARLTLLEIDGSVSPFASWVLAARPAEQRGEAVRLLLLENNGVRCLLGVADMHQGVKLPASPMDLRGVMPSRARWFDRESGLMEDPVPFLSETERAVLRQRMLEMGLDSPLAVSLLRALEQADKEAADALERGDEDALAMLALRVQAVCGLHDFAAFSVQEETCDASGVNPLVEALRKQKVELPLSGLTDVTYQWNGIPFARTSRCCGLTCAGEAGYEALAEIARELELMRTQSVRWNAKTGKALDRWLEARKDDELFPAVREHLTQLRLTLSEQGRQIQPTVTLEWPWLATGAVQALLEEALGAGWMEAAKKPFSDRLTKLTDDYLGDTALQTCCACAGGVLVPPLSREMAKCVAEAGVGAGLAPDALRFLPREDGGITASFLLRGQGEVRMVRTYSLEELLVLEQEEAPQIAVWPCLPMAQWRAYHVFLRSGRVTAEAMQDGMWQRVQPETEEWRCLHTQEYPACLVLSMDDECLGALPNMLPACETAAERDMVAAVDLGSISTAAVLAFDDKMIEAQCQPLTRTLTAPVDAAADDFLASLTPGSIVPTAVELVGPGEELFTDGFIYRAPSFDSLAQKDPSCLFTSLKWRSDEAHVRAKKLLLHQVMLGTSLTAVLNGARSICWRVTVADEMDEEGRGELLQMAEELAGTVALETGLPLTLGKPAVEWAEEAAALQAYLRDGGGCRGSFVSMDLGGASTKMHLWMQGKDSPAAGTVLFDGVQKQLAAALVKRPELLESDFADCMDPAMRAAVDALCIQLRQAGESLRQADKAMLMLTTLMDEYRQPLTAHLSARLAMQRPTYLQSILLELMAASVYTAGLMLAQVGDDTMINHRLPEDITVCLTGRGAWLLDTMPPALRNNLQHLARSVMRLDHPVRFITLKAAPQPAMSTALGMAVTREVSRTVDAPRIRTKLSFSQMMCDLMRQLAAAFPMHQWLLHEGMFDQWGNMTQEGEELIRRTAALSYGDGKDIPASIMDFIRRMRFAAIPVTETL